MAVSVARMAKVLAAAFLFLAVAPLTGAWSTETVRRAAPKRHEIATAESRRARQQQRPARRGCTVASHSQSALHLTSIGTRNEQQGTEDGVDPNFLREELSRYLEKRRELGADKIAEQEVGKQTGGTRGNALLEYVSFAPNKGSTVDSAPNIFDYSELQRYGYPHLATPIMKSGGRLAMYDLMGLERPPTSAAIKSALGRAAPSEPIVFDRTGQTDSARYTGLKLGQVVDDNLQAQALAEAERKVKRGEALRPRLVEEQYERPFADLAKKSTSSNPNPYWTAEKLDDWGKMRGRVIADARRADLDKIVPDRMETLDLEASQRLYAIAAGVLVSAAFGKSTPTFLTQVLSWNAGDLGFLDVLKAPAAVLLLASLGSAAFCATQASSKQRNAGVWLIKGILGGPLALQQFRDLPTLVTRRELEAQQRLEDNS